MYSVIKTPTIAILYDISEEDWPIISKFLTYKDSSVQALINNHARNLVWKRTNVSTWEQKLKKLNDELVKRLYTRVDATTIKYRPALSSYFLNENQIKNGVIYPPLNDTVYTWIKPLPYSLRSYQKESICRLMSAKHAHVELTTGIIQKSSNYQSRSRNKL